MNPPNEWATLAATLDHAALELEHLDPGSELIFDFDAPGKPVTRVVLSLEQVRDLAKKCRAEARL